MLAILKLVDNPQRLTETRKAANRGNLATLDGHLAARATDSPNLPRWVGRMRVGNETLTVPKYGGVLVRPNELRQVFNDTDAEVLWLIIGGPEELEFLQGSKSKMNLSLIYPVDPKQLPKELAGAEWPRSES